jgi:DNA-binding NarL/FixJ family response regulator
MGHDAYEAFRKLNAPAHYAFRRLGCHRMRLMTVRRASDERANMFDHAQPTAIRVIVVDDHDLFRTGITALLDARPEVDVVAQASSGRAGVRLASEMRPDVVLMDLRMPDMNGAEATRDILNHDSEMRIVVLTVVAETAAVTAAMEAGACGFLSKDTPIEGVVAAIRAAAEGGAWLSPRAAEVVLGRIRSGAVATVTDATELSQLSPRELDVLRLIARGMENGQIAETLTISRRTAKNHVSNILAKLGLPSRVQAAVYAVRRGLD